MSETTDVSALELAALMCSRVCHDVISPVGAITNGLEVLADDDDLADRRPAVRRPVRVSGPFPPSATAAVAARHACC